MNIIHNKGASRSLRRWIRQCFWKSLLWSAISTV
jgi:hypothetical protein